MAANPRGGASLPESDGLSMTGQLPVSVPWPGGLRLRGDPARMLSAPMLGPARFIRGSLSAGEDLLFEKRI